MPNKFDELQEDKFAKKALQLLGTAAPDGSLAAMTSLLTPAPDRNKDKFLFDLVRALPCQHVLSVFHVSMPCWQAM